MLHVTLSVLMSVFNETESQIKEAVKSILTQTFSDFELIIIVDNPKREELRNFFFQFEDNRIRYYMNEKNIGLAMSMNKAASLANADIFVRMDSDDVATSDRFEVELNALRKNKADLVFSNYDYIDVDSRPIITKEAAYASSDQKNWPKSIALRPAEIHHPTVMFKKSIFYKVGGYRNFPCTQDADLWLRMSEYGCSFYKVNQILLHYRVNPASVSCSKWFQQQLTSAYIFELSCKRLVCGYDNFSVENYKKYLDKYGISNPQKEKALREASSILSKSNRCLRQRCPLMALYYRILAQLKSKIILRHTLYFLFKKVLLASRK